MKNVYVEINLPRWLSNVDFDHKKVRKVILTEARQVRKMARRLVARRAVSKAGEFPGRVTGALSRSIKVFAGRGSNMFAVVRPHKTAEMEIFHPGLLFLGSKRRLGQLAAGEGSGFRAGQKGSNRRRRGNRQVALQLRQASGEFIIAPRENYMEEALNQRRYAARDAISAAVQSSLIPRK